MKSIMKQPCSHILGGGGTRHPLAFLPLLAAFSLSASAEPDILNGAFLHYDASRTDTLTTDGNGGVTGWANIGTGGGSLNAAAAAGEGFIPPRYTNGWLDFGPAQTKCDMTFSEVTNIRTVFWVIDIAQDVSAFLLGHSVDHPFHRGRDGQYWSDAADGDVKNGTVWDNGIRVNDPLETKIPTGPRVISFAAREGTDNLKSDSLTSDRNGSGPDNRYGGRRLAELLIFTNRLDNADRRAVEERLYDKWTRNASLSLTWNGGPGDVWTNNGPVNCWLDAGGRPTNWVNGANAVFTCGGAVTVAEGVSAGAVAFDIADDLVLSGGKIHGRAPILKTGTGTLTIDGGGFENQPVTVSGGILKVGGNAAEPDALGSPFEPLRVTGSGTMDIANRAYEFGNPARSRITFDKEVFISGTGAGGNGAIINTENLRALWAFSGMRMEGDATVNSLNRMDVRGGPLPDGCMDRTPKAYLFDPTMDATLTIVNPDSTFDPDTAGWDEPHDFALNNMELEVGKVVVKDGGGLGVEEWTILTVPRGIDFGSNSTLRIYSPISGRGMTHTPSRILPGASAYFMSQKEKTVFAAVRLEADSTLKLRGSQHFDGGLDLASGSKVVTLDAEEKKVASLSGTGTLSGAFNLTNTVWDLICVAGSRTVEGVAFEHPAADALSGIGKIRVTFGDKPKFSRYAVCPALGLPEDPALLAGKVETRIAGNDAPYDGLKPVIENGGLILVNLRLPGSVIIIR